MFAVLSSTLALQMALDAPLVVAMLFGFGWGLAILSLDRWLVAANSRQERWWQNLLVALPRILMALVIGVVMSTPLVLRMFQSEIDQQLVVLQQQAQAAFEADLRADPRFVDLPDKRAEVVELQEQIAAGSADDVVLAHPEVVDATERLDAVSEAYDAAELAVACERDGTCGSGRSGAGPAFAEKVGRRDRLFGEREQLTADLAAVVERVRATADSEAASVRRDRTAALATLEQEVSDAERLRGQEVEAQATASADADGLLARIEALETLSAEKPVLHLAHLVLLLFLTVIECLPVLVKLFLSFGKPTRYEVLVQQDDFDVLERRRQALQRGIDQTEIEDALELDRRELTARVELRDEAELAAQASAARLRLAGLALDRWESTESSKLQEQVIRL